MNCIGLVCIAGLLAGWESLQTSARLPLEALETLLISTYVAFHTGQFLILTRVLFLSLCLILRWLSLHGLSFPSDSLFHLIFFKTLKPTISHISLSCSTHPSIFLSCSISSECWGNMAENVVKFITK